MDGTYQLFGKLRDEEYESLKADIAARGVQVPVEIDREGEILDGHHRAEIADELGIEYPVVKRTFKSEEEKREHVLKLNMARRHLAPYRWGLAFNQLLQIRGVERKERARNDLTGSTLEAVAKEAGVSPSTAEKRLRQADRYLTLPAKLRRRVDAGEFTLPDAIREDKRSELIKKNEEILKREAETPTGVYDVIVVDPPWPLEKIERDVTPEQVELGYPTMSEEELAVLPIPSAEDCHLWLWTTHKYLPMAFRLLGKWDFKYVCTFVWHKPGGFQPFGLPQYNCEFALYARRGSPQFVDTKAFPVCFKAPRTKHSEKPNAFYEMVARVAGGRRLDMFNRREIEGFDGWGNESK